MICQGVLVVSLVLFGCALSERCAKKTTSGKCCVFPFTYKSVKYYKCITKDHSRPWCSTTANYDKDKQWGDCRECPKKTTTGKCCVFPFIYQGANYTDCTSKNHGRLWCSTTANYDINKQWGDCQDCAKRTTTGRCCVFPFTYLGVKYTHCTLKNHKKLWCSTTAHYDRDKQWGNCQDHFCPFDNGTCGYSNTNQFRSEGLWKATQDVHGIKDHTYKNGSFLVAEFQYRGNSGFPQIAQLSSPLYENIGCVQFLYYRKVQGSGSLDVIAKRGNNMTLLWSVQNLNTGGWKFASIPVTVRGADSIELIFQSDVYIGDKQITAIDDVNVTSASSCYLYPVQPKDRIFKEVQGSCHFDTSSCGYSNNNGSRIWRRNRLKTLTYGTGPDYDHTFKTGGYMFAEASGIKTGKKSQLIGPTLTNVRCASFYYHMYGSQMGELNVYERVDNVDHRVFNIAGNQGKRWQKGTVYLDQHATNASFKLVFESVRGPGHLGDIAIDDLLTLSSCRRSSTTPAPTTDLMSVSTSGSIPFPTTSSMSAASSTIPAPTTIPTPTTGAAANIRLVNGPSKYEGRVEVFHNGRWGTVCDDSWDDREAAVTCKMLGFPGHVRSVKSAAYGRGSGTIWLDDIRCTGKEKSLFDCRHAGWGKNNCGHGEDAGVVCQADFVQTPNNGTCTFDLNTCGYTNADRSISEFDWTRQRGNTPSSYTGPRNDVSGSGYYMYIEVSSGVTGARAKLISPMLPPSTKCITFYYNMRGSDIGTLNVYIQFSASNSTLLWSLIREQGNKWLQGQLPLNAAGGRQFQVIFEGVRGNDYKGDIAIDSIFTLNTTCNFAPTKARYQPDPNAQEGEVRLVGGVDAKEGRVEIYHQGQWGTICKNGWTRQNANVVCRMLGFVAGQTVTKGFGVASGPIWLDGVKCNGKEQLLTQCTKKAWGYHSCSHGQDVAIKCKNGTSNWECENYRILNQADRSAYDISQRSLRCDKNLGSGIYPGEWHRFEGAAGKMMSEICIPVKRCSTHAPGWLSGSHPRVEDGIVQRKVCFHWSDNCCRWSSNIRVKNCSKFYVYEFAKPSVCQLRYCGSETAAGPTPPPTQAPPKIKIRLVGGSKNYSGRVEVYHKGRWGTVCDDSWDIKDANVACRMLGYPAAYTVHLGGKFPGGTGKIWLDNVMCKGNEDDLWSCRSNNWNNCDHSEDAGVTCFSNELYLCNFEEDLCGYSVYPSGWISTPWVRQKADKHLMDHTFEKQQKIHCLNGWATYNNYCYYFKHRAGLVTWHNAKRRCVGMNAWLIDIRDKAEWNFVKRQRQVGIEQYHIGIHEVNKSNVWTYYDGSIMKLTDLWAPGEPNNWNGNNEDCGAMDFRRSADGKFNDIPCGRTYGFAGLPNSFVCKKEPSRAFGHYLIADLSRFQINGHSTFTSIVVVNVTCIRFYFTTNGTYVDNVKVLLNPVNGKEILVWKLEGDFGKQWNRAQIPVSDMGSTRFQIKFYAIRGSGKGKMIIDDIDISIDPQDTCTLMPKEATPPSWKDVGSCNFDINTCNYSNIENNAYKDELDWYRIDSNRVPDTSRSPSKDHTTLRGSYMWMKEPSTPHGILTGHVGRLISPIISPNIKCVIFYWYVASKHIIDVELTVYVRPAHSSSRSDEVALWNIRPSLIKGGQWNKGQVPLSQNKDFQIIFEGMYSTNDQGLSLDDIIVLHRDCSIYPNFTTPPSVAPTTIGIRLAGSSSSNAGRVEILHQGRWGTLCGDNWNMNNAHVVCRQLGYIGALAATCCGMFGKGWGRVWLNNIRCSNNPQIKSISLCPHNGWGNNQCTHSMDAGVICQTSKTIDKEMKLRLSGGKTPMEGRVDVNYVGVWGTIDCTGWDILDATVVCRQLNFTGAVGAFLNSNFGPGNGPVWFSSAKCKGNESSIAKCIDHSSTNSLTAPNHNKDAGVECFDARLVGGKSSNEGRVEIKYRGKWGTICNKGWNMKSSNVICRNLGYLRAKAISSFGNGIGEILLSDVECTGSEISVVLCPHRGWNVHECDHSQDVGVVCTNEKEPTSLTPCSSGPCKNNGKCKVVGKGFSCQCTRNYIGEWCQTFIGSSLVSVLLKGDIKKWDAQKFKESIAKILSKYCQDCIAKSVRTKREIEKKKSSPLSSDDVIIVEDPVKSSRSPPGYLYVVFVVVKTKSNGKSIIIKPSKIRQAIDQGAGKGIGGYTVIGTKNVVVFHPTRPNIQPQARTQTKSSGSIGMKIGFAVVLTILIAVLLAVGIAYFIRRRNSSNPGSNSYILRSVGKTGRDNEILINEEDNQVL